MFVNGLEVDGRPGTFSWVRTYKCCKHSFVNLNVSRQWHQLESDPDMLQPLAARVTGESIYVALKSKADKDCEAVSGPQQMQSEEDDPPDARHPARLSRRHCFYPNMQHTAASPAVPEAIAPRGAPLPLHRCGSSAAMFWTAGADLTKFGHWSGL